MRGSVVGSGLVHLVLLVVLLIVRAPAAMIVPGPDVVQVALVDPSAPILAAPRPEPPPEPTKEETIRPVDEEGVKLQPKKPPKPKEPDRPREKPIERSSVTLPSAPAGTAGLRGDVAVDGADFEFTYYLVLIRNKIASNWAPPAGLATSGNPIRSVVYFKVTRGGGLADVRMESASGVEFFDRSALRAVALSDPLPPLPLGYSGGELGVHFGFEWESP